MESSNALQDILFCKTSLVELKTFFSNMLMAVKGLRHTSMVS